MSDGLEVDNIIAQRAAELRGESAPAEEVVAEVVENPSELQFSPDPVTPQAQFAQRQVDERARLNEELNRLQTVEGVSAPPTATGDLEADVAAQPDLKAPEARGRDLIQAQLRQARELQHQQRAAAATEGFMRYMSPETAGIAGSMIGNLGRATDQASEGVRAEGEAQIAENQVSADVFGAKARIDEETLKERQEKLGPLVDQMLAASTTALQTSKEIEEGLRNPVDSWGDKNLAEKAFILMGAGFMGALNVAAGQPGARNPVVDAINRAADRDLQKHRQQISQLMQKSKAAGDDVEKIAFVMNKAGAEIETARMLKLSGAINKGQETLNGVHGPISDKIRANTEKVLAQLQKEKEAAFLEVLKFTGGMYNAAENRQIRLTQMLAKQRKGGGTGKPKTGNIVEIGPGEIASPFIKDGNGNPINLNINKNNSRANKLIEQIDAGVSSTRTLLGLLAIPDNVLDDMLAVGVKDRRWDQIRARMADLQIRKQALIKGIPSDKDAQLLAQAIGGNVTDVVRFFRESRAKAVWADALSAQTAELTDGLQAQFGNKVPGIQFVPPTDAGNFALNMTKPGTEPSPREGVLVSERGQQAGGVAAGEAMLKEKGPAATLRELGEAARSGKRLTTAERRTADKAWRRALKEIPPDQRKGLMDDWEAVRNASKPKAQKRARQIAEVERRITSLKEDLAKAGPVMGPQIYEPILKIEQARLKVLKSQK